VAGANGLAAEPIGNSWDDGGMTWTAPQTSRVDPPPLGDERTLLDSYLDYHRHTLLWKCSDLTAEQLRMRIVEPSSLSLLGLLRHMAEVERVWFRRRFAGEQLDFLYSDMETNPDGDFDDVDKADAETDHAAYVREVELARAAAAGHSLDETFYHSRMQQDIKLRWVYLHMIEEYARHNGHADLLRERIDGATGE
jgi:uncharacterized damage-inducible protein DinB